MGDDQNSANAPEMEYSVIPPGADPNSEPVTISENDVANHLKAHQYPILGSSHGGLALQVQDAGPPDASGNYPSYQVSVPDALTHMGYQVKGISPKNSYAGTVDPSLGALADQFGNDEQKKIFLEKTLEARGIENPIVAGSGDVWHVYSPEHKAWAQLTEKPGWNKTGFIDAALQAPRWAGMGIGGGIGAMGGSGIASIPGAALGGALGSASGQALTDTAIGALDPAFREAALAKPMQTAEEIGGTTAGDAVAAGLGGPISKILPLGSISEGLSSAGKAAGKGISGLFGKAAANDAVNGVVTDFVNPLTAKAGIASDILQLPKKAVIGLSKVPGWLAEHIPGLSEESAAKLSNLGTDLSASDGSAAKLGKILSQRSGLANNASYMAEENAAGQAARDLASAHGLSEGDASSLEQAARSDFKSKYLRGLLGSEENPAGKSALEQGGEVLDQLHDMGESVGDALREANRGILRGVAAAGKSASAASRQLPGFGYAAQYMTPSMLARYLGIPALERGTSTFKK